MAALERPVRSDLQFLNLPAHMKVVVTFAVHSELAPWLRLRDFRPLRVNGLPCYETTLAGAEVLAVPTGIGASHAARTIGQVLKTRSPDVVVASGLAGALKPAYRVGDVLAARLVRSGGADRPVSSSDVLLRLAVECGAKAVDSLVSVDDLVRTAEEKALLSGLGDCVDMESLAVLTETAKAGIAAVAVRSVADTAECDLPCDFSKMLDECGRMRMWRLALEPLREPHRLPALVRFAFASHHAARRLAGFLDGFTEALLRTPESLSF